MGSAGETWNGPDDPWDFDYQPSTIVVGVTLSSAGYQCWDVDPTDHHATCTAGTDTSGACEGAFSGKAEEDMKADACPENCTFTAAVTSPAVPKTPHVPAVGFEGFEIWSGACRGPGGEKVNGKYVRAFPREDGDMTEGDCMRECCAHSACVGYHHGPWCSIFGPGIDKTAAGDWGGDSHPETTIVATKPNVQYICAVKGPTACRESSTSLVSDGSNDVSGGVGPDWRAASALTLMAFVALQ